MDMDARRATGKKTPPNGGIEPAPSPANEARRASASFDHELLTVDETADLLRTSRKAVYALVERSAIPGVVRLGRRILFNAAALRRHLGLPARPPPSA